MMRFNHILLLTLLGSLLAVRGYAETPPDGAKIYRNLCAECHGPTGRGGTKECPDPLIGDNTLEKLTSVIHKTMPEDDERKCRDEDAAAVASYIYDAFYSPAARARNQQAHIEFSRLTVRQYEESIADLFAEFVGRGTPAKERGLTGKYFASRGYDSKKHRFERVDPEINFHFGQNGTPEEGTFEANEFSMTWSGCLLVEDTGIYEFNVKTENGFNLWVNDQQDPLLDGWVASGGEPSDHTVSIKLLGGRVYPIRLDWFKFKDKSASVELRWKPPHKGEQIIPQRNLAPNGVSPVMVVQTEFPPDDASVGYPRGTSISPAWNDATTRAAIEIARVVTEHLDHLSRSEPDHGDRHQKVKDFCLRLVEGAFRHPLSEEERTLYVERQFERTREEGEAVKRVVLLALKSPQFLYPELNSGQYLVANRLAMGMWDSLPDRALLNAAQGHRLETPEHIRAQANRMLSDPRTQAKIRHFFHRWLMMDEAESIAKDTELFPGFDDQIVADLRTSLDLFLEDVVWNGNSDYRHLLLGNYMFLNKRLAQFYGSDEPKDEQFVRVDFDPQQRTGVVTHPYLLSTLAYHKTTSPIHRGVFLTRNLLGRTLKPPPKAVAFEDAKFDPHLSMREKVAELTRPANCQTCHCVINPLGFSLEQYDAIGRFRTHEDKRLIDAAGEYPSEDGLKVKLTGARSLAEYASNSQTAQRGFVIQLFNEVAKQPIQAYGEGSLDKVMDDFRKSNYNMKQLLVELAVKAAQHQDDS